MTTSAPAIETITINNNTLLTVNLSSVTKLTSTNYLMWSLQVHALLDGHALADHLDESAQILVPTIVTNGVTSVNPAFTMWTRQDKLIYGALLGAISSPLQTLVSRAKSASQIWNTLASTYAKPSRGHIRQLRDQLKIWKKDNKTIDEYVQGLTTRFDQLAILGSPISHEDQIDRILDGLPDEYRNVVDQIEGKDSPPMIPEVHERLLNQEAKLLSAAVNVSSPFPITANNAQQRFNNSPAPSGSNRNYNNRRNNNNQNNNYSNQDTNWQPNPRSNNQSPRPYLGKCQLCSVQGHSAKRCPRFPLMQPPVNQSHNNLFRPWQPRANLALGSPYEANQWLLDTGATHHMTSDLHNLSLHQPYSGGDDVLVADGSSLAITNTGSKIIPCHTRDLQLHKVLHVPDIHRNLISVYRLCNTNQVSVEFFPASFQVKDLNTGTPLLQGKTRNDLYEWPISPKHGYALSTSTTPRTSLPMWHSRLGHPSTSVLNSLVSTFMLPVSRSSKIPLSCSDCHMNKSHKLPFSQTTIVSKRPLEYLFSDVWTSPILSIDNYKYYLVIVDHFTRYTWLYPLRRKSDVKTTFITFKALVENKFQLKIGTFFSDNGGEFVALRSFFALHGISHLTSPPHTPEHNGISERKHRHVVETGLTLLSKASIPTTYWPYAFSTAVYLINRLPTPVLSQQSPFLKLFKATPNYKKLKIFGCLCFPWLKPYVNHKLESRSQPCVFLGYSLTQSAYLCLHVSTGRIYTSRHVTFEENQFPFPTIVKLKSTELESTSSPPVVTPIHLPVLPSPVSNGSPDCTLHHEPESSSLPASPSPMQVSSSNSLSSSSPSNFEPTAHSENGPHSPAQIHTPSHVPTAHSENELSPTIQPDQPVTASPKSTPSVSTQISQIAQPHEPPNPPPVQPPQNTHKMNTRAKNHISKPKKVFNLNVVGLHKSKEPSSVTQALKDERWRGSMSEEYDAQILNHSWDLVPPHPSQNVIGCRWVFTTKYFPSG